ncbi:MAG: potassium transporter TrkG, partial [Candidatus Cryptobacteroides sp.]
KADRLSIVFQTLASQIRSGLHPSSVSKIRAGGHYLSDSEALPVLLYVILYCSIMIIGILLLTSCGVDVMSAVSGTVASMGNVGPGLGELGTFGNFTSQQAVAKYIYSVLMILGRLEIYPVLAVFTFIFKRRH